MLLRPTDSYQIEVPDNIISQSDMRVVSFWMDGQPLLLQLSSLQRTEGPPIPVESRLEDRIKRTPSAWARLNLKFVEDGMVDQAFATQDDGMLVWIHGYFVWQHLTVYATMSGPKEMVQNADNRTYKALSSLSLAAQ